MVALHRLLRGHHPLRAVGCPAPAAALFGILATGFLLLAARQLVEPLDRYPGRELVESWWLLELVAIWSVPVACWLSRIPGAGALLLGSVLPVLTLTALAFGVCCGSPGLLCGGVVLLLVLGKCASLQGASDSPRARELVGVRALVGVLAGLLGAVAALVVLVVVREISSPAGLRGSEVAHGAILVAGAIYFASLAVLEVKLAPPADSPGRG